MKKKIELLAVLLLLAFCVRAQSYSYPDTIAMDLIQSPDGDAAANGVLDESQKTILVIFNPKCGHCLSFMDSTLAHYDELENVQFLFVYGDLPILGTIFEQVYDSKNMAAYDRLHFGKSDNDFFDLYMITYMPGVYVYEDGGQRFSHSILLKDQPYAYFLESINQEQ